MCKKIRIIILIYLLFVPVSIFADDFTDAIQDLAVRTACVGQYSATEGGGKSIHMVTVIIR